MHEDDEESLVKELNVGLSEKFKTLSKFWLFSSYGVERDIFSEEDTSTPILSKELSKNILKATLIPNFYSWLIS